MTYRWRAEGLGLRSLGARASSPQATVCERPGVSGRPDHDRGGLEARAPRAVWALCIALIALMAAVLPQLYFLWHTPPGYHNTGILVLNEDAPQYLAAIRQGMLGHLLYTDQFTTLPVPPILMYPLYMLIGWLFSPLQWSEVAVFNLLHIVYALALVWALWPFARTFAPAHALSAYALALFGGSLALIPIVLGDSLALLPFLKPELGTMQALLLLPHEAAGLACQALILVLYQRGRSTRHYLGLVGLIGLLALSYPFNLPLMLGVIGGDALLQARDDGRITPHTLVVGGIVGLFLTVPLYYWHVFHALPYWRSSEFLHLPIPAAHVLFWVYGPIALLAAPRLRDRRSRLLLLWIVIAVVLIASGLAQPLRMLAGLGLPCAVLAATQIGRVRSAFVRRWTPVALSLSGLLLPVLFIGLVAQNARNGRFFHPASVDAVCRYLDGHTTARDVVLADYEVSNILVGVAPAHVVAGHGFETFDYEGATAAQAWYPLASVTVRRLIEDRYRVTYVVVDRSRKLLVRQIGHTPRYHLVYANDTYQVYTLRATNV